jgi:hypothetical protein
MKNDRRHLRERKEQRQIAPDALELQCLGGLDALPRGRDLCVSTAGWIMLEERMRGRSEKTVSAYFFETTEKHILPKLDWNWLLMLLCLYCDKSGDRYAMAAIKSIRCAP